MGFLEWFCGKKESVTSKQFADMMKKMSDDDFAEDTVKKDSDDKNKDGDE